MGTWSRHSGVKAMEARKGYFWSQELAATTPWGRAKGVLHGGCQPTFFQDGPLACPPPLIRSCRQPILNEESPLARKIRMLENRLDKSMIKYNEAQSIRKTYPQGWAIFFPGSPPL